MASGPADAFSDALELVRGWRPEVADLAPVGVPSVAAQAPRLTIAQGSGSIAGASALIASGELDATTLTERALAAITDRNEELHAFVEILEVEARARARQLDVLDEPRGPLHGIPISVKDLYSLKGATTRAGSLAYERRDTVDSSVVARLRQAGAVLLGKTSLHEFAMGVIAPASRNPVNPSRIAGGSSSGAAIAAATGMGLAAVGTDTRGSVRIPAAFCGVVGFKPSSGLVELDAVVPLSWSLDHFGVLATSLDDAALVFGVALGHLPTASEPQHQPLRIGLPRAAWRDASDEVQAALEVTIESLVASGCEVVDALRPSDADFDAANLASIVVSRCEAAAFHRSLGLDPKLYSSDIRAQLDAAGQASAQDYIDAQRLRSQLSEAIRSAFEGFDVMLMPTVPITAPPHEGAESLPLKLTRNVAIWSFLGFPAISLPARVAQGDLPVGAQLVAPPLGEARLLEAGRTLESALR